MDLDQPGSAGEFVGDGGKGDCHRREERRCAAVPETQPHDRDRFGAQGHQLGEILVLGEDRGAVFGGIEPEQTVGAWSRFTSAACSATWP